jgi:hypothetical protein
MTAMLQGAQPPAPRHYDIGGQRYVRVSTVLNVINKPTLNAWKLKVGAEESARISKESTEFGTRLHACIERINRGQLAITAQSEGEWVNAITYAVAEPPEPDLLPHAEAYNAWFREHVDHVVGIERLVVSHVHGYAGTADFLPVLKTGELTLIDYKSDKTGPWAAVKPEHRLQLAAYRLALAEEGIIVKRRLLLQLPKNEPGRLIVHELDNHKRDTLAWLACLELWRFLDG